MNFPDWTPESLKPQLQRLYKACPGRRLPIFDRILSDSRMTSVYGVLLQHDRESGRYRYAAKRGKTNQSAKDAQTAAIGEILKVAISAASDRMSVSRIEEIEEGRKQWKSHSELLRAIAQDMALAAELGILGFESQEARALAIKDAEGLLRVASWLDHLRSATRRSDDPLVVERHRGDPVVKGVQILIASQIEALFGNRLDGTAATLAGVALGAKASPRASRSALA
jgi:hypothetical protein